MHLVVFNSRSNSVSFMHVDLLAVCQQVLCDTFRLELLHVLVWFRCYSSPFSPLSLTFVKASLVGLWWRPSVEADHQISEERLKQSWALFSLNCSVLRELLFDFYSNVPAAEPRAR